MTMTSALYVAALLWVTAGSASAVTLLASDFNGRSVSGDTASQITWTTNGIADPANVTVRGEDFASGPFGASFFDTSAAQNRLGVDLNIENEGSWFIDVALNTLSDGLDLSTLAFDGFTFNNLGRIQTVSRELDVTLAIVRNSDSRVLFSAEENDMHLRDQNGVGGPFAVSFDVSGTVLDANSAYTLTIGANSDRRNRGNNGGFDNLTLTGDVLTPVPLPAGGVLLLSALAGLALRRKPG